MHTINKYEQMTTVEKPLYFYDIGKDSLHLIMQRHVCVRNEIRQKPNLNLLSMSVKTNAKCSPGWFLQQRSPHFVKHKTKHCYENTKKNKSEYKPQYKTNLTFYFTIDNSLRVSCNWSNLQLHFNPYAVHCTLGTTVYNTRQATHSHNESITCK